jgi:pimeloyl-ACP methyl ester carboxylesterase
MKESTILNSAHIPEYKFFKTQDGYKISYLEYGDKSNPTVFCVHGLTRNATDYHFLAETLSDLFHVISIDIVGRGSSDWIDDYSKYNYFQYLRDIKDFLRAQNIYKMHWVGTSMGGVLGILLASKNTEFFIEKLILNDSGPFFPMNITETIHKYLAGLPNKFENLDQVSKTIKNTFSLFGMNKDQEWDFFIKHSIIQDQNGLYRMQYDPKIIQHINLEDDFNKRFRTDGLFHEWSQIHSKILLIWGQLSSMLRYKTIEKMEEFKKIDKISITNAGHTPHLMNNKLNNSIKNWLLDQPVENLSIRY